MTNQLIKVKKINSFLIKVSSILQVPKKDRDLLCKSLVGASLRGVDSHGIRLFPHYVKCLEEGRINIKPEMSFKKTMPAIGILNADDGFGHVAAYLASKEAIKLAKKNGVGIVGIINSSHYGAAGAYTLEISEKNFIGLSFTHSDAFAVPHNGVRPFHGTNPYSFSAPLKGLKPLLVDFASTTIPWNKVMRARNNKTKLDKDLALDKNGNMTTNPDKAVSLFPLGGELFGHKGFGLSSSIEVLCGPFLGMMHGFRLLSMIGPNFSTPRKLGHLVMAININSITTKKKYFSNMSSYIKDLKKQKSRKQEILYPGEKEWKEEKLRTKKGIPFDFELINSFLEIDKKYNLNYFNKLI